MNRLPLCLCAAALTFSGACADENAPTGALPLGGMTLLTAPLGDCTSNENLDRQFPRGADRVVLELTGGAIPAASPVTMTALAADATAAGEVVVPGVPPGEGMTLRVVACAAAATVWAGETHGLSVSASEKSFPTVFLTPVDTVACTGNAESNAASRDTSEPRAFAALTADAEAAYVFGGFAGYSGAPSVTATATSTVDRYTRLTGEFVAAGGLQASRGMALAVPMSDGRIKVVGGTKRLLIANFGKPALWTTAADAPEVASELYDPTTGLSEADVAQPLPALPGLVATSDGTVFAVGGVEPGGVGNDPDLVSDNITRFAADGATSGTMPQGRYGATVVDLGGDRVLVYGGNIDGDTANVALIVSTGEAIGAAVQRLTVNGAEVVPIFAAAHTLPDTADGKKRVLLAGGGRIQPGPVFDRDITTGRLQIVTIDAVAGSASVASVAVTGVEDDFKRAGGRLVALGGGEYWLFGGYTAFVPSDICGGAGSDCLQSSTLRFSLDALDTAPAASAVGTQLELSVGPLGAEAVELGDGARLMTSGIATITQTSLGKKAALVRFAGFARDLCAP